MASAGLIVAAGCLGDSNENDPQPSETKEEPTSTASRTPTETPTASSVPAEIVDTEVFNDEPVMASDYDQVPWVKVDIRNSNPNPHGQIQAEQRFLGEDGSVLQVRDSYSSMMPPNSTWRYYFSFVEKAPSALDDVEVLMAEVEPEFTATQVDGAEVVDSNLTTDEHSIEIIGEVELTRELPDRVVVIGLLYDEDGVFRGSLRDVESNPQESVVFSRGRFTRRPPSKPSISEYEVIVLDGHP